jgi:hypothetical protein
MGRRPAGRDREYPEMEANYDKLKNDVDGLKNDVDGLKSSLSDFKNTVSNSFAGIQENLTILLRASNLSSFSSQSSYIPDV